MIEYVALQDTPSLNDTLVIVAFTGWPDAGDVASTTVRHLIQKLDAKKFGQVDPEPFLDFSQMRPQTVIASGTQRSITWPVGELYAVEDAPGGRSVVLYVGPEPHLLWRTFTEALFGTFERCGMTQMVTLGGTYDNVPHTGAALISGVAAAADMTERMERAGVTTSDYEGPASVHSAFLAACAARDIPAFSLWGHAPHYVHALPNWKVTHAMLQRLARLTSIDVDVDELRTAGATLERRVERALRRDPELQAYVRHLQEQHEVIVAEPSEPLLIEDIMLELEDILRPSHAVEDEDDADDDEDNPLAYFDDEDEE